MPNNASRASEKCKVDKRKTLTGEDVIHSLRMFGYERYLPVVRHVMQQFREVVKTGEKMAGTSRGSAYRDSKTSGLSDSEGKADVESVRDEFEEHEEEKVDSKGEE